MINNKSWAYDILLLTAFLLLLFGIMLGSSPLEVPDGARYAEIPREMVASGDYVTPHLNSLKYFEKPPLFYWMQAISIKAFGLSDWSVRAMNALMAIFTSVITYIAGRKLYNRKTGIFASIILSTGYLFFALGRLITLDMALTAFLSASLLSFICSNKEDSKNKQTFYMLAVYAFAALATMTKGLIGIIFPIMILFLWVIMCKKWKEIKKFHIICGSLVFLAIALPWHIWVQIRNPEFFNFYFIEQHFLRYLTSYAHREQSVWFFPICFVIGFFPWIFFLPQAITESFKVKFRKLYKYPTESFMILWPLCIFVFYAFSSSKLIPYILPMFPPLAIVIGHYFSNVYDRDDKLKNISTSVNFYCLTAFILSIVFFAACKLIDFNNYAFTPFNVYLSAIAFLISSIGTCYVYHKHGVKNGLIALFITNLFVLFSFAPSLSIGNGNSIKPLIDVLLTRIHKGDEIASYRTYYQDLPYYSRKYVTLIGFDGELEFGMKHAKNTLLFDEKAFWQRWNSNKKIFLVTEKRSYNYVKEHSNSNKLYTISTYFNTMLLSNVSSVIPASTYNIPQAQAEIQE